ncbi:hypothetical protein [Moorena bouillonii]|nr:hypothetical protein [Moorena bouillonii]
MGIIVDLSPHSALVYCFWPCCIPTPYSLLPTPDSLLPTPYSLLPAPFAI